MQESRWSKLYDFILKKFSYQKILDHKATDIFFFLSKLGLLQSYNLIDAFQKLMLLLMLHGLF